MNYLLPVLHLHMDLCELLKKAFQYDCSDIFIIPGSTIMAKSHGKLIELTENHVMPSDVESLVKQAYVLAKDLLTSSIRPTMTISPSR